MDAFQLREYIVKPALESVGMYSEVAEDLIMGTAAQESLLSYVKQLGNGPAVGLFQMEPNTYHDIWENYLMHRHELRSKVISAIRFDAIVPDPRRMIWDHRLAAIMCRIHYRRVPAPLPEYEDIEGYAAYWKKYYNTILGAGTTEEYIKNFELVRLK